MAPSSFVAPVGCQLPLGAVETVAQVETRAADVAVAPGCE